ncbi:MAG: RNA polymerase factor sigma-54 [Spirochaetales bacterium]|nr:RNA polymerase factor sigma-54 [Spirochaetales bacterium]
MQYQKPVVIQDQRFKMNPQLLQSIQLMAMPIQELKLTIREEIEKNPALEVIDEKTDESLDSAAERTTEDDYDYFENSSDPGYSRRLNEEASDSKRKFMEGALSRPENLHEHLVWQLQVQPISPDEFRVGELLIQNLDDNGFHLEDPGILIKGIDSKHLPSMLKLIQGLDPVGTCTVDYRESLIIQANLRQNAPDFTEQVISDHLDLLDKSKFAEIARKLKTNQEQVLTILEFIKTLQPFPGRQFSTSRSTYVIPDLLITMKEGEFYLVLNDEEIPVLGVNPFFTEIVKNGKEKSEKSLKRFVNTSLKDARWFIRSIHQRNQTLLKIAKAIVEFQRDFFMKGRKYLVPLTLKDIADEVEVHETTVSRITTAKYVQTEWGIFELKYFFSNSISGAGSQGSRFSKEGVKQIIKEIIEEDASERHLSDQKIADILKKQGINLARRTVAKYRNELDIDSSYRR